MPIGPTNTKAQKQKVVKTEMHKFKEGDLHSGSKHGPVVKNPKQAIAISLSESGQSKKSKAPDMSPAKGKAPKMGAGESKSNYDRSSHFAGNPGFPQGSKGMDMKKDKLEFGNVGTEKRGSELIGAACTEAEKQPHGEGIGIHDSGVHGAEHHKDNSFGGETHKFPMPKAEGAHGYGHAANHRSGHLRMSGHSGAHRIGSKKR